MGEYDWQPGSVPTKGSTVFNSETFYLVRKSNGRYCRVEEYEILNTELRSQLFMHSYGYLQSTVDFGDLTRYLERVQEKRGGYLSLLGDNK